MSERFRDWMAFMGGGFVLAVMTFAVVSLWLALTEPNLPFCERWAPAASLPPAYVLPAKKVHREIPIFFCQRFVSINQCRMA